MWMGTYPSVPSYLVSTGETLEEHLKKNPELVGKKIVDQFGPGLPFLPKVWEVWTTMP
jgi:mannose-6-phosphate isomerase